MPFRCTSITCRSWAIQKYCESPRILLGGEFSGYRSRPAYLFVLGVFFLPESPRWLFRRGRKDAALAALLRTRTGEQAGLEIGEMEATAAAEKVAVGGSRAKESLFQRKYLIPFALACVILGCNQLTGVNSIIGYCPTVLIQAGLSDVQAHAGHTILTTVNVLVTVIAVVLVDRKGRKFLLSVGTAGIIVSLACTGLIFQQTEKRGVDCKEALEALVVTDQELKITFDQVKADALLATAGTNGRSIVGKPATLSVIYSFGDYVLAANVVRSDVSAAKPLEITRRDSLPGNSFQAFMQNPLGNLARAQTAPLKIQNAIITPVPSQQNGWFTAVFIYLFMAFFAVGPGVCVLARPFRVSCPRGFDPTE